MGNRYFAQYLLNKGILTADNAAEILSECRHVTPDITVIALEKGWINDVQAQELARAKNPEMAALDKGIVSASQLDVVHKGEPDLRVRLGQVIWQREMVDLSQLAKLYKDNSGDYCQPVREIFGGLLRENNLDANDYEHIEKYVELFLATLQKIMNMNALLLRTDNYDTHGASYFVYQNMGGALSMAAGCKMSEEILAALASRYSGENIAQADELAIDCVEEFANVLNGLYTVNMSDNSQNMDLDMPCTMKNADPVGGRILHLRVESELGSFMLYLSMNGFMFNDQNRFNW